MYYNVIVNEFTPDLYERQGKLDLILFVKRYMKVTLKEAKKVVENGAFMLAEGITKQEAIQLEEVIESFGAIKVSVREINNEYYNASSCVVG